MGWATNYIAKLLAGETVTFRPRGNSMTGKIDNGQLVVVEPVGPNGIGGYAVGDVVLCKVGGNQYLHLVKAFRGGEIGDEVQIANNHGYVNGWTKRANVYGRVCQIEDRVVAKKPWP